ncbi:MAG: hypothetical protein N3A61_07085, partial [Ignavibacteria bacterium]|nr:hypothetical protein [Ignavibacteria bacterium]
MAGNDSSNINTEKKLIYDPLIELMKYYSSKEVEVKSEEKKTFASIEEKLKNRIINGEKVGLQSDLDEALKKYSALDI